MIILENLTCGYSQTSILKNICWHIKPGEHWVVTGDMGSGKTTLLQTLYGKTRKLSGTIKYRFLQNPESFEEMRNSVQLVSFTDTSKLFTSVNAVHYYQQRYQAFDSNGHLTTKGYLDEGGLDLDHAPHRELVDLLDLWSLLPLERIKLSSGQIRKVLLCKAFLSRPKFLLLDNPHIGLDDYSRHLFNDYLDKAVSHFDQQVILSGHFRSLPQCINKFLKLENGTIKSEGDLMKKKRTSFKEAKIPSINVVKHFKEIPSPDFKTVLKFDKININYQEKSILQCLDWTVQKGEKWVVQGPNGSGKSTLISLIYGDHPQAYSNKITLFDRRRGTGESIWDIKNKIGFTSPELHSYFNYNHPAINVVLSGLNDTFFVQKTDEKKVVFARNLFEYFNLSHKMDAPFFTLSTGMQRLLFFMRALIKAPPVLLMDEPYQGIDNQIINQCNELLGHLLSEDHTLIFISHFPDEVPQIAEKKLYLS